MIAPGPRAYVTLVASLPHLARFDRMTTLPISRERLLDRLEMLHPDDREAVDAAFEFLAWQRQPADRSDGDILTAYEALRARDPHGALSALAEYRLLVRTLMAALRRSVSGRPFPRSARWGLDPWASHVLAHRDHPHFRLQGHFPWIVAAREMLERGDSIGVEHLTMRLVWDHIEARGLDVRFDFDSVLAYLFRWDIVQRWLCHDASAARNRLDREVARVLARVPEPRA